MVHDASDHVSDPQLWARGYFGLLELDLPGLAGTFPQAGPVWGGGPPAPAYPQQIGGSTRAVLRDARYEAAELDQLFEAGVAVEFDEMPPARGAAAAPEELRIDRGELARTVPLAEVEARWRAARNGARS